MVKLFWSQTPKSWATPRFPPHTHTTLYTKKFGNYRILTINVAAEF
jgi:hypothetical protein